MDTWVKLGSYVQKAVEEGWAKEVSMPNPHDWMKPVLMTGAEFVAYLAERSISDACVRVEAGLNMAKRPIVSIYTKSRHLLAVLHTYERTTPIVAVVAISHVFLGDELLNATLAVCGQACEEVEQLQKSVRKGRKASDSTFHVTAAEDHFYQDCVWPSMEERPWPCTKACVYATCPHKDPHGDADQEDFARCLLHKSTLAAGKEMPEAHCHLVACGYKTCSFRASYRMSGADIVQDELPTRTLDELVQDVRKHAEGR